MKKIRRRNSHSWVDSQNWGKFPERPQIPSFSIIYTVKQSFSKLIKIICSTTGDIQASFSDILHVPISDNFVRPKIGTDKKADFSVF